jgi:hypothetical protein
MLKVLAIVAALIPFSASAEIDRKPEKLTAKELAACRAKGGHPEMVLYYVEGCVWPTHDAGKTCVDKSDCEGFCEAPLGTKFNAKVSGQCSKNASERAGGCTNLVESGRSRGDMCVH